jgi:hypothetical protein
VKIRVTVILDVDPEAWSEEYSVDRKNVRRDVVEYVKDSIYAHFQGAGMLRGDTQQ